MKTEVPTPGEVAYETYVASRRQQPAMFPWRYLQAPVQAAWEAAAQAVLGTGPVCLVCGTRLVLQRCTRFEDPHWPGCLSCGGIGYVVDCPGAHTDACIAAYAAREREKTR
jgi:hypothetical protein